METVIRCVLDRYGGIKIRGGRVMMILLEKQTVQSKYETDRMRHLILLLKVTPVNENVLSPRPKLDATRLYVRRSHHRGHRIGG